MRRLLVCLAFALFGAVVGPRLVGPQSRAAGLPFIYEPPEHFVPVSAGDVEGARAWVLEPASTGTPLAAMEKQVALVRVVHHHSGSEMSVEEADLAKLASEMAPAFENACTWVHRRHELRTRKDGARVGLIEGDCDRDVEISTQVQKLRTRKLQLMFPEDGGTAIITASFPTDQAARWEPLFEATIHRATGVAVRAPSAPWWTHAAFAAAGALLAWLATAIVWRRPKNAT